MVTFICYNCDATLKKNQVEKHALGRCRNSPFICIDCHVTFNGNDYKAHVSCLTQFQKHWGEFAKPKQKSAPKQIEEKKEQKKQVAQEKDEVQQQSWKGWKNEIKFLIKQNKNKVELTSLKEQAFKRYRSFNPSQDLQDKQMEELFEDKLKKLKKVKIVSYVSLE